MARGSPPQEDGPRDDERDRAQPDSIEARLQDEKPDYVVIFPWNLREEIMQQLDYIRAWDGRFVIAVPELTIS